ncbi:MAG: diaminopimelate epimerase, partial [Chloroflexi bacterium]|nr:diaminopimelate epimerase [Chloroflexota bacterium]
QMLGYSDEEVSINLPGGILEVSWDRKGEVLLGGKAEIVFEGEWQE